MNLRELRVIQYYVAIDKADSYATSVQSVNGWLNEALPTVQHPSAVTIASQQSRMDTSFDIDLQHSEHIFAQHMPGLFSAAQLLRHVTIMANGTCAYLTAGYHRCFARCANTPTATVPSAVVAVAAFTLTPPPPMLNVALGVTDPGLDPFGIRAANFSDFFTDTLFMDVNLRKKRYQLQVRSTWVAIDDPTP